MSESGVTSEKKVYRVPSTMKKVTMCLTRGSYSTFACSAVKIPQLKTALVAAVAGLVRNECQDLCSTTNGLTGPISQEATGREQIQQRKRSLSPTDIGSPSAASMPSGRPPAPKRPLVVLEERSRTRRSLEFGLDPSADLAASPVVNVVSVHSKGCHFAYILVSWLV